MVVSLSGSGPLHRQLYKALRDSILSGRLRPGTRLPPTRELASQLRISRNVVVTAYENLAAAGYIHSKVGVGTTVATDLSGHPPDAVHPQTAPITAGILSAYAERALAVCREEEDSPGPIPYDLSYYRLNQEDFPAKLWRRLQHHDAASLPMHAGTAQGDPVLCREIAAHLRRCRGLVCEADHVLPVNGSQQALDLVARVLVDPGNVIAMEEPHYAGAREIFQSAGAKILPIPVDSQGLMVEALPPPESAVRLVYLTPSHQFPTGAVLSLERRIALLTWAERVGAYILEDDYDGDYCYDSRPLAALQGLDRTGRVLYTGTFSRLLASSFRLGYLVIPPYFRSAFTTIKRLTDWHTSPLSQRAIASFLSEGHFDRHFRRSRTRNAVRRNILLAAIHRYFEGFCQVSGESAGTYVFIRFPSIPPEFAETITQSAARKGIRIQAATDCYLGRPPCAEFLLGYNGLRESDIASAIRLLRSVLAEIPIFAECDTAAFQTSDI